jgi:hypothetical protein
MRFLKSPIAAALFLSAAAVAVPHPSLASDADFILKNMTGYQIDEVYVGPHSSDAWGNDIMGKDALADGEQVKIIFPHGGGICQFDIKVKYHDDGSTARWMDVNLCKYESITLFWDAKNEVTRAVGE